MIHGDKRGGGEIFLDDTGKELVKGRSPSLGSRSKVPSARQSFTLGIRVLRPEITTMVSCVNKLNEI